ncbi:ribbon-helix-helix domain-containing protein [Cyanobium sp. FGCU-52]|nr:ribbon-helix-helix domain-containing protein [Cyanobium sp. FGCU52]
MRTTLTLDDDLAEALNRKARLSGRSFKAVVNETIRRGLAHGRSPDTPEAPPFAVQPQACGLLAGIDPLRFNQLLDPLEIESFTDKQAQ